MKSQYGSPNHMYKTKLNHRVKTEKEAKSLAKKLTRHIDDQINELIKKAIARYTGKDISELDGDEFPDIVVDLKELMQ